MNELRSRSKLRSGRRVSLKPDQIDYLLERLSSAIARSSNPKACEFMQDILDRLVRGRFNRPNGD